MAVGQRLWYGPIMITSPEKAKYPLRDPLPTHPSVRVVGRTCVRLGASARVRCRCSCHFCPYRPGCGGSRRLPQSQRDCAPQPNGCAALGATLGRLRPPSATPKRVVPAFPPLPPMTPRNRRRPTPGDAPPPLPPRGAGLRPAVSGQLPMARIAASGVCRYGPGQHADLEKFHSSSCWASSINLRSRV